MSKNYCKKISETSARIGEVRFSYTYLFEPRKDDDGENGKYFAHTLNNTVVAPPRMLIAFLENNLNEDGSIRIPQALRMYMGGADIITPKK